MKRLPKSRFSDRIIPCLVAGLTLLSDVRKGGAADFAAAIRPMLKEYCVRCHGGEKIEGEVDLTGLVTERELFSDHDLWLSVIEQVDSEEMPTKGPFPSDKERATFTDWLRNRVSEIDWSDYRSPGRVTLPRMTRTEYRNTFRDLLGIDLRAGANLPEDGEGESGFTNDRDNLSLTPAQMEQYFISAERAIDGVFALAKPARSVRVEAETMERSPAKLSPHEQGIVIVHPDHELQMEWSFPADGWYTFRLGAAVFGGQPCVVDVRVDGEVVASVKVTTENYRLAPDHEAFGFVGAGRRVVTIQSRNLVPQTPEPPDIVQIIDDRARERAPKLGPLSEKESVTVREIREGLNLKSWGVQECIEWLRFLGPGGDSRKIDLRRTYLAERQGQWDEIRDQLAKVSGLSVDEIDRRWQEENSERLADGRRVVDSVASVRWEDWMRYQGKLFVDRMEIAGPVRGEPAENIRQGWNLVDAISAPDANPETIIRELLPRAFRRPVEKVEADRYVELLQTAQRREELREEALAIALTAILTSPKFLYREEHGTGVSEQAGDDLALQELDDWALASRLSYFLWQSMPDAELFDLAASGWLKSPETLVAQADRMVSDPKSDPFFEAFSADWLGLRELGRGVAPDPSRFPEFTPALAESMREEATRFLASVFREDQPVTALLDSPVTFLNEKLAEHYGIAGVKGDSFQRVNLPDARRGGVLGLGGVLVVTSSPARTNPVRRGAWVLDRLLGEDPGEALPTAGVLPGDAGEARGRTLREELEIHRNHSQCARCHDKIDPIGFGLQNFDATGRWRELEAGAPVDARGQLPGGSVFSGPIELKQMLRDEHHGAVVKNVARRLLAFALGRELSFTDEALVREMVAEVDSTGVSSRTLIRRIVTSEAFRFQSVAETRDGATR
ncbi:MAG: DUF1592 domain-containing protein [Verrucomicrobiae bacterium]|nr:DUF1592 domain-containing protein [Verrucomicrobiae bacterium]